VSESVNQAPMGSPRAAAEAKAGAAVDWSLQWSQRSAELHESAVDEWSPRRAEPAESAVDALVNVPPAAITVSPPPGHRPSPWSEDDWTQGCSPEAGHALRLLDPLPCPHAPLPLQCPDREYLGKHATTLNIPPC
jgi:hypothetical protein